MQVPKEEKLIQLEKILRGRTLHGSENLKAFLRFVVGQSVEGQEGQLKEYVIATEVFGRGSDFDPRIDSVVRVQAGRLRTKLHEYYATEGEADTVIIDLPKGQYLPVFSYSQRAVAANGEVAHHTDTDISSLSDPIGATVNKAVLKEIGASATSTTSSQTRSEHAGQHRPPRPLSSTPHHRGWMSLAFISALLALVFGLTTYSYRTKANRLERGLVGGREGEPELIDRQEIAPLWGVMLNSSEQVLVVYSNTLFQGSAEEGMRLLKPLNAPGSSLGSPIIPQSEIEMSKQPVIEHYTGVGEVMGAFALADFFARVRHAARIKRSLLLTWEDLKTENIVVLGSPAENLFLRDLPQKQDFIFKQMTDENGKKTFGILNTRPQPGELERYFAKQDGPSRSQISEDYAVVSLLQGVTGDKRLLILAGITTLGTQAASEYVTKLEYIKDLITHLNLAPADTTPKLPLNFQILVRVKVNGGVPVHVSYVTHHVLN
jgi:hypothetical protein